MFFLLVLGVIVAHSLKLIEIKNQIDLFGLVGVPAFVITIWQLLRGHQIQSFDLVRSHMTGFLSNKALRSAFMELIYTYNDDDWNAVKAKLPKALNRESKKTSAMRENSWKALETLNIGRAEGRRLYDPDFFQGSEEEKRLDAVLHFFDVLAYGYRSKMISVADLAGVAGYHLTIIGSREVTTYFLKRNKEFWDNLPYRERVGAEPPFENLRVLLKAVKQYNRTARAKEQLQGTLKEKQP